MLRRPRSNATSSPQSAVLLWCAACAAALVTACGSNGKPTDDEGGRSGTSSSSTGGSAATAGSGTGATGGFNCTESADPGEMVQVPAGEFSMGCNDAADKDCSDDPDEQP